MKKLGLICFVFALAACNNDRAIDPLNASSFYFVRVDPQAATIAQGGSQQLNVTAFDNGCVPITQCNPLAPGNPISVNGIPTFRFQTASDSNFATISSAGVVTAKSTGRTTPVTVNVIGALQNIPGAPSVPSVTLADTTPVTILATGATPPTIAGMTLTSSRSTNGAGSADTLTITYTDAGGATVATQRATTNASNLGRPAFFTSDPSVATVSSTGIVTGVRPGSTTITASNTIGGVTKTATFPITITDPITATISITTATSGTGIIFFPDSINVSATEAKAEGKTGAVVTWAVVGTTLFPNTFTATTTPNNTQCFNVTFADPTVAQASTPTGNSGNIGTGTATSTNPPLCNGTSQSRLFTTPGTYRFTSTTNGAAGVLVVK